MSKSKRRRSASERFLWLLSLIVAGSMMLSLVIVALPSGPSQAPTSPPTLTLPEPTATPTPSPLPFPTMGPTETLPPSPTVEATEPPAGPVLPTDTPGTTTEATEPPAGPVLPTDTPAITLTVAATASPTVEATEPPAGPVLPTDTPAVTPTLTVTPSSTSLGFTFAVCGDSRNNPAVYRQVLEAVAADGSEFLLHTGDLVNQGTEPLWQEFQETMAGFALPFYPVPGNHDGLDGGLDGYLQYSGAPAAHYSFDREPVHFTLADSHNGGISAAELAWLRHDLSATTQLIKMVFLHHPPFDPDGTDHIMAYGNESLMALLVEQGVDYVFAGHIHAYAQEERDGIVYTITGGAGAPLYSQDHPQAFHHYLRVTVQGEDVTIEVVKI